METIRKAFKMTNLETGDKTVFGVTITDRWDVKIGHLKGAGLRWEDALSVLIQEFKTQLKAAEERESDNSGQTPWRIMDRVGMSGATDYWIERLKKTDEIGKELFWYEDGSFNVVKGSNLLHISGSGYLNEGLDCSIFDLLKLIRHLVGQGAFAPSTKTLELSEYNPDLTGFQVEVDPVSIYSWEKGISVRRLSRLMGWCDEGTRDAWERIAKLNIESKITGSYEPETRLTDEELEGLSVALMLNDDEFLEGIGGKVSSALERIKNK